MVIKVNEFSKTVDCDVLVVGSGAGGLSAAVTAAHGGARVIVIEKAASLGGATSWSGGWMWTPGTSFAHDSGVRDDSEVRDYLRAVLGPRYDELRIESFLQNAPKMVDFFQAQTSLQFVPGAAIHDIYGDLPGAGTGYRSVGPKPINGRRVPRRLRSLLRRQLYETSFLGMGIMAGPDLQGFLAAAQGEVRGIVHAAQRVGIHFFDLLTKRRGMQFVNGTALTARLAKSAIEVGVEFHVHTAANRLLVNGGRVTGVVATVPNGSIRFRASLGVVVATGGYPHDVERRARTFPRIPTGQEHWGLSPETCDGSGIRMAEAIGAHFSTDVESAAAWCPVSLVRYRNGKVRPFPHIMDRAKPGSIGVLRNGRRFVNEANGYYDYVAAMMEAIPEGEAIEAWQIADSRAIRKYSLGMAKMRPVPLTPYLRSGYLVEGRTIGQLATKVGIDPDALERTVREFNEYARVGTDPLFGRGTTPFNRYGGDARIGPNPSLAPLELGPFYAVNIKPGSFGTFAGVATDERARALRADGSAIEGLHVVGSDQSSVMGGHYPSGGINLGPAMTFGFIAGRALTSEFLSLPTLGEASVAPSESTMTAPVQGERRV